MTHTQNTALRNDLMLVALLIAVGAAARLLPHAPNFTPIAASALFAGTVLRHRALAFLVPLGAMLISDIAIGFDQTRLTLVHYALLMLPATVAYLPVRARAAGMFVPIMLGYSLVFFAVSNFAVWAVSGMYPLTLAGLSTCYALALPFLAQTVIGDLVWTAILFGGAALFALAPRKVRTA